MLTALACLAALRGIVVAAMLTPRADEMSNAVFAAQLASALRRAEMSYTPPPRAAAGKEDGLFAAQINDALQATELELELGALQAAELEVGAVARVVERCVKRRGSTSALRRGDPPADEWCTATDCTCLGIEEVTNSCALNAADFSAAVTVRHSVASGSVGRPWYCGELGLPRNVRGVAVAQPRLMPVHVSALDSNGGGLHIRSSRILLPPPPPPPPLAGGSLLSSSCACLTSCARRRTQPQDPLPWCYTHPSCLYASRILRPWSDDGFHELCLDIATKSELPKTVSSCTRISTRSCEDTTSNATMLTGPRDPRTVAWRHCGGEKTFWEWPAPSALVTPRAAVGSGKETCCTYHGGAEAGGTAAHAKMKPNDAAACGMCSGPPIERLRTATVCRYDAAGTLATKRCGPKPSRFGQRAPCTAPEAYAKTARHFLFQASCAPDGLGSNSNAFKIQAFLARKLKMKLVWNQELFISENTPQYIDQLYRVRHPLNEVPGDLFHPLGLDLCAPSVARNGPVATPTQLFEKIEKGELIAHVSDDVKWVNKFEASGWIHTVTQSLLSTPAWKTGVEHVIVIRNGCQELLPWNDHAWWAKVFAQGRRTYRPTMPIALQQLPAHAYAVVVHVRWGDIGVLSPHKKALLANDTELPTPINFAVFATMLNAVFNLPPVGVDAAAARPLSCANAGVIFVIQADEPDRAMLRTNLRRGRYAKCSDFLYAGMKDQDGSTSARDVFAALDMMADADVLIGGGTSQFTRMAAALGVPSALRIMHNSNADWFEDMRNIVHPCADGKRVGLFSLRTTLYVLLTFSLSSLHVGHIDARVLSKAWSERHGGPRSSFIEGCRRIPPKDAPKGSVAWWARQDYEQQLREEKAER